MSFLNCPLITSFIYHFFVLLIFFNLILLSFSFLHLDDQIVYAFHFGKFHLFHKMVQQLGSECGDLLNIRVKNLVILFDFFQKNQNINAFLVNIQIQLAVNKTGSIVYSLFKNLFKLLISSFLSASTSILEKQNPYFLQMSAQALGIKKGYVRSNILEIPMKPTVSSILLSTKMYFLRIDFSSSKSGVEDILNLLSVNKDLLCVTTFNKVHALRNID